MSEKSVNNNKTSQPKTPPKTKASAPSSGGTSAPGVVFDYCPTDFSEGSTKSETAIPKEALAPKETAKSKESSSPKETSKSKEASKPKEAPQSQKGASESPAAPAESAKPLATESKPPVAETKPPAEQSKKADAGQTPAASQAPAPPPSAAEASEAKQAEPSKTDVSRSLKIESADEPAAKAAGESGSTRTPSPAPFGLGADFMAQTTALLSLRMLDIAQANFNASFEFARQVAAAKDLADVLSLQTAYLQQQFATVTAQTEEMAEFAKKFSTKTFSDLKPRWAKAS